MLEQLKWSDILVSDGVPSNFNWFGVLKDLIAGAEYTAEDHSKLRGMAGRWTVCACGQLCTNLPRHRHDDSPKDQDLRELGGRFYGEIADGDWSEALEILYKIENRAELLLTQIGDPTLRQVSC